MSARGKRRIALREMRDGPRNAIFEEDEVFLFQVCNGGAGRGGHVGWNEHQ